MATPALPPPPATQRLPLLALACSLGFPLLSPPSLHAEIRPAAIFSHNAVLQQGRPIPIWGSSDPNETITVEFRGHQTRTTSANGRWIVRLPREAAGGPDNLVIRSSSQTITLTNILVGEVWICSGQSNMEWSLARSENPQPAIDASANPNLRLFTVPKLKADAPVDDVKSQWEPCNPLTVPRFSAVAYHFGAALQHARQVPVGLIHTSWGGSPAEVWMRPDVLASDPDFKRSILDGYNDRLRTHQESLAAWEKETAELRAQGKQPTRQKPNPGWKPSELYHGMIAPIVPYGIAGAIWYQGESNAGRAQEYSRLFPAMIRNWRHDWDQGDFPFLAVQLAPWDKNRKRPLPEITATPGESDWAELREAQLLATRVLPKVGMAVITDVGDKDDIHPTRKKQVGDRLALLARKIAYRERLVASGPEFLSLSTSRGRARLTFDHVGQGLVAKGGPLTGFQICGSDRQWTWAEARIEGRRVIVSSPKVPEPIAVRYGWADFPVVNLFNADGLPASPFRTDNFPMVTAPKP
jgi:sialate O-acetylesterase